MKALIILKNAGNTVKTQTLECLTNNLGEDGDVISKKYHYNGHDFVAIVGYHGLKIGIITIGDPGTEEFVSSELKNLYNNGCDVIVASSRNRGRVYQLLWEFGKDNDIDTMETSSYRSYSDYHGSLSYETINQICAKSLLGAIHVFKTIK